ncbi:MAG: DMT family transporter [Hyphomicrobiales bacterium]|nr:DMT family transporter [Hyphomicrobiales bacterium]MCP4999528.1 DMT family transporter [Hyphomicrobiales bacterium]
MGSNTKGALVGLLGFGVFATHDVIVKYLGATYSPYQILFFSVMFGFPLVSFMLVRDMSADTMRPHHPWWTALRTVSILVSSTCIFYAFSVLPLTQTYSILFSVPLIITLLSIPILGERVGIHRGGAVVVGLVGVLIVVRPGSAPLEFGHLAAFVGAFGSALSSIIVRRIGREERDLVLLLYPMLGSFLVMGALMPFEYKPMPLTDLAAVAVLSLLGFIALNCMIGAYKAAEAAIVAPMQYSQILWATLFGLVFFNEAPEQRTLVGAVIIIVSGLYIVIRESRTNVSENTPVLRNRSRIVAGTNFRIGPMLRSARKRGKKDG